MPFSEKPKYDFPYIFHKSLKLTSCRRKAFYFLIFLALYFLVSLPLSDRL